MKKQKIQLIVIVLLLALVGGGYYFVTHHDLEAEEESVNLATLRVTDADADTINELSYDYEGETLTFVKEDGTWYYKNDKSIPIIQSEIANMATYVASISPASIIEEPSELSVYGLDKPLATIKFTCEDGSSQELYIGEYFDMDGTNFAMAKGDDTVYTIAAYYATTFAKSVSDLTDSGDQDTEE